MVMPCSSWPINDIRSSELNGVKSELAFVLAAKCGDLGFGIVNHLYWLKKSCYWCDICTVHAL